MERRKKMKKFVALGLAAILACGSAQSTWAASEELMLPAAAEAVSVDAPAQETAAQPAEAEVPETAAASAKPADTAPTDAAGTTAGAKTDPTSLEQPAAGAGTESTAPTESASGAGTEPTDPAESVPGAEAGTKPAVLTEPAPGGETGSTEPADPTESAPGPTVPAEKPSDGSTAPKPDTGDEAGSNEPDAPSDGLDEQIATTYEIVYYLENAEDDGYTTYHAENAMEQGALGALQDEKLKDHVTTNVTKEKIIESNYKELSENGIIPKRLIGFGFEKVEFKEETDGTKLCIYYKRMRYPYYILFYDTKEQADQAYEEIDKLIKGKMEIPKRSK